MWATIVIVLVMFATGSASADILEWRDASGVSHYTNLKEEVPDEQRGSVQVVVDELVRRPQPLESTASPPPEPRHQAQVIYDRSTVSQAYIEGLERGLQWARASGGAGGAVQINGPLAVANAAPPSYAYLPPYIPPLLTTSFDRGRSRYLTLRLLLQDQFAIDREGPFIDARLGQPLGYIPPGVALNPFLPRGLPQFFPRETRVIRY
jgi:hypothetical protein